MLWNPRESRLNGKSGEAVETNAKLDKLLLAVNEAYDTLVGRKQPFDAEAVKNLFQGGMATQTTLLKLFDRHVESMRQRIGVDRSPRSLPNHIYTQRAVAEFIKKKSELYAPELTEMFGKALNLLGVEKAFVVHGHDGMDEMTTTTLTRVTELNDGMIKTYDVDPLTYFDSASH